MGLLTTGFCLTRFIRVGISFFDFIFLFRLHGLDVTSFLDGDVDNAPTMSGSVSDAALASYTLATGDVLKKEE